ncbi:MAG: HlyD family efflux transporter periplasmic adaptor subunit [Planctomycetaceae bacterium]
MATTTKPDMGTTKESGSFSNRPERNGRSSNVMRWVGIVFGLVLLLTGAVYAISSLDLGSDDDSTGLLTHQINKGRLLITVTEDGNVESASNVDVKCQVAGGGTIIFIVEDGKQVEKDEVIVRLDESGITDQLNTQKIAYEKALAAKIQAEEDFSAASIAVREYAEGTFIKELQTLDSQITIAMENLRSAENMLAHTEKMARKGFATSLQLEADQFAVQRGKIDLEAAKTAKTVLEKFTREKTLKQLESTRDAAEARKRSEQAAFELEKGRLDRLQRQLEYCVIKAPQSGMVIYANEQGRGRSNQTAPTIEEGAIVREQQTLIRLPNLSRMQVKVTVHETKVDQIRPGMPARIKIQDREFTGKVVSIANQPEPGGWMSSNVKEYATNVAIDGETNDLKPGMTAEVEILVADQKDVLMTPVSAVVEQRGKFYAWVRNGKTNERRPLLLGKTNDKVIEVRDGLKQGDQVLLNPRAVVAEAQQDDSTEGGESEAEKGFGAMADAASSSGGDAKAGAEPPKGDASAKKEDAAPGREGKGEGKSKGKGGGRSRNPMEMFKQADANADGKITPEELPERIRQFINMDEADTNKNGGLEQAEFLKLMSQMRQRMGGGGGGQNGAPRDSGGSAPSGGDGR